MNYLGASAVKEGVNSVLKMMGKPENDKLGEVIHAVLFILFLIAFLFGVFWVIIQVISSFYPQHQVPNDQRTINSSTVITITSSTVSAPVNSPTTVNVSGTGNATAVGAGAQATVNNTPPPTFSYQWVVRYPETINGVYTEIFDWVMTYPVGAGYSGKIISTSPFLSCSPTPSNSSLPGVPSWAKTNSLILLDSNKTRDVNEVTCTSTSPIVDNGKLFVYQP